MPYKLLDNSTQPALGAGTLRWLAFPMPQLLRTRFRLLSVLMNDMSMQIYQAADYTRFIASNMAAIYQAQRSRHGLQRCGSLRVLQDCDSLSTKLMDVT